MSGSNAVIVNEPAPDWLTLTTFDEQLGYAFQNVLENHATGERKKQKRMQYDGWKRGQLFLGLAEQGLRPHYMFQASGMGAAIAYIPTSTMPVNCTRIDLQITVPCPRTYDSRYTYDILSTDPNLPDVALVQSGDGLDTIYIGKRVSRRFYRLYVKPDAKGARWLRFEVEYKKDLAGAVWDRCKIADDAHVQMGSFLRAELNQLPFAPGDALDAIDTALEAFDSDDRASDNRVASSGRTLKWLMAQVAPAVMRAMHDHDEGPGVRDLVRVWADWADRIDKTPLTPDNGG